MSHGYTFCGNFKIDFIDIKVLRGIFLEVIGGTTSDLNNSWIVWDFMS